jgi:phosphomethylpyrimidine synthase
MPIEPSDRARMQVPTLVHLARGGSATREMAVVAEREGLALERVMEEIATGTLIIPANIHHANLDPIGIGRSVTCKINANIGNSQLSSDIAGELEKLQVALRYGADTVMDLSTGGDIPRIRGALLQACRAPLGTVPVYEAVTRRNLLEDLEAQDFVDVIRDHAVQGVDFVTVHCGLLREHVPLARRRRTGIVSRGGSLVAQWMLLKDRQNPLYERFDDILAICRAHDLTLSLGDGLRPGCLADASDDAQFAELEVLGELSRRAREAQVQVMIEGPGHVPFDQIASNMQREHEVCEGAPFYVLGPLVTDIAPGYDHITSAIGATMAAYSGASMLCYVTPSEHLGLPDLEDVRQGVVAYRIAAHAADVALGRPGARKVDDELSDARFRFDWERVFRLSLDEQRARERFAGTGDEFCEMDTDYCSMCGPKFCAMRLTRLLDEMDGDGS